jgi:hypothetical protein
MKDSGSMNGGSLQSQYVSSCGFFHLLLAFFHHLIEFKFRRKLFTEGSSRLSKQRISRSCHIDPGYLSPALTFSRIVTDRYQNEPQNSNPTYPTCSMTPDIEGQIGRSLRSLLNSNGLSNVKVIGYEVSLFLASQLAFSEGTY